jgi:hypothetical protein
MPAPFVLTFKCLAFSILVILALSVAFVMTLSVLLPAPAPLLVHPFEGIMALDTERTLTQSNNDPPIAPSGEGRTNRNLPYATMQGCIDDYTSRGTWKGDTWTTFQRPTCSSFANWSVQELPQVISPYRIGFMGDSTTRSDLRAFEETYGCPRTDLDEATVFQKKDASGKYICHLSEQSRNLTKCGIPPVVNMDCTGVSFRYYYKVYPWTPLDAWYFAQPELFRDIDVLVISLGRWFAYYGPFDGNYYGPYGLLNITRDMDTFLFQLKQVFSGLILYQSEYPLHTKKSKNTVFPVPCAHAKCGSCDKTEEFECEQTVTLERPQSDLELRSVVERHQVLYLDRWNISKSLPLEYYQLWYCGFETYHQWYCDHHLYFVALQHLRLIANVVTQMLGYS